MSETGKIYAGRAISVPARLAAVCASLMLGACAQVGSLGSELTETGQLAKAEAEPTAPKSEMEKAIAYWAKEYEKAPRELKPALAYARNLKAAGQKERALGVLQHASMYHAHERELQSEYGRLALDLDQVALAQKLLEAADDPGNPDWKIISARGTALAKQGSYAEALPFYERALAISPNQASVLNNYAMALAADGQADKAEAMLRRAADAKNSDPKVRRNLALVLGLQGKHDDAKQLAAREAYPAVAVADADHLRMSVKAEAKPASPPIVQAAAPATKPTPLLQQASAKTSTPNATPAVATDNDAAAEAIIQKAIQASIREEKGKAGAAKAKDGRPPLKPAKDDVVASDGSTWQGPVAQGATSASAPAFKPSTR